MWNKYFILMGRLKKILDSWNVLCHRMRNQDEVQEVKAKPSFPTTGIIGAIAGDCFGAAYEFNPVKSMDFDLYKAPRFTDDTVMTLAVAKWLTIDQEHGVYERAWKKVYVCWLWAEILTLDYQQKN